MSDVWKMAEPNRRLLLRSRKVRKEKHSNYCCYFYFHSLGEMVRFVFAKNVTLLELHAHISLKELILVDRINGKIANATGAVIPISTPAIGVGEVQADRVRHHVA